MNAIDHWQEKINAALDGTAPRIRTSYAPNEEEKYRWSACFENDSDDRRFGFGPTEHEAIFDLKRLQAELIECDERRQSK